jgi:BCD family chlorophyll transporter-like MFS transporter
MFLKRIQLGLIHVAVAMTLVPINSTLNRVMIKELAVSATLVAVLASLPYLFSPIQMALGAFSDRHPFWGWRRTPYILLGLFLCAGGMLLSPWAAFLLPVNLWAGIGLGLLAFGAWGMGYNLATVSYLSLATELSGEKGRGRTIAIMWFMMITSIIITSIALSQMVDPFTAEALVRSFWVVGLAALALGLLGLLRLEPRASTRTSEAVEEYSWGQLFGFILENRQAKLFFIYLTVLLAAILGQDILLEPFGGEAFGMSVKATTRITSLWGVCVLVALLVAGFLEGRIGKRSVARVGGIGALAGFLLILVSGMLTSQSVFYSGVIFLGIGTGLATVSNLSLMLDMTTPEKVGLFIGAWGMSNAVSRLLGTVLGGAVRDIVTQLSGNPLMGYILVFGIEAAMVALSLLLLQYIDVGAFRRQAQVPSMVEKAAIATD